MDEYLKVIVFSLNGQRYGLDIHQVLSIEKIQEITMVPGTSNYMKGVMNLRGEVIPVMDLKERLHIGEADKTNQNRVLIVSLNDVQVGLIVDAATDVLDIKWESIEEDFDMIGTVEDVFIRGLVKMEHDLLILLNLDNLLDTESELRETEETV